MSGQQRFIICATTFFSFLLTAIATQWPDHAGQFVVNVGIVLLTAAAPLYLIHVVLAEGDRFNEDDNGYIHASEWPGAEPEAERTPVPAKREPAVAVVPFRPRRVPR